MKWRYRIRRKDKIMVGPAGFEPATKGLCRKPWLSPAGRFLGLCLRPFWAARRLVSTPSRSSGLGSALACFFRSLAFAEFDELLAGHSCPADPDCFCMGVAACSITAR